ncbi:hypothetical protein THAOC_09792 [Thalassiosira oceanica]|uniref:Uncharacterized protein n=1 Tax=Thalassiosira oceanica TaxID=159749 RepID=K0SRQ2_THAOC|nr:hypothetical protein THAOC_09792 [Thalassiosira oceanica]|eukprot:EJK68993.1 hypothetical protein THAOC_09792 [Thalassiosira oceanica]
MRRRKVPTGHHGSRVVKLAAVIGRGKERDQLSAGEELVPVLDYLVGPDDQVEIVLPQELLDHVLAERKRDAAILRNGVSRTEQTSRAFPYRECQSGEQSSRSGRRSSTRAFGGRRPRRARADQINADGKTQEKVTFRRLTESPPCTQKTLSSTIAAAGRQRRETRETYLDASTSECPGENPPYAEEILGVLNLVRQNANGDLDGLLAPVDVVAEEEIIRLRRKSPVLEDAQQIVELPVGIACAGRISARGGTRSGRTQNTRERPPRHVPTILIGADNSSSMGWPSMRSRARWHTILISASVRRGAIGGNPVDSLSGGRKRKNDKVVVLSHPSVYRIASPGAVPAMPGAYR